MLGKLIKHELRATSVTMLPVMGLMLLVSAMANLALRFMDGHDIPGVLVIISGIVIVIFFVGLFALGLVSIYVMAMRFRNNLLRDEGYIMHTLPVSVHAHIWSKVIVSTLWYAATAVCAVLSGIVVSLDVELIKSMGQVMGELIKTFGDINNLEILAEMLVMLILSAILMSLSFYASLSVGHSFANRKMLSSIVTFVVMFILWSLFIYAVNYIVLGIQPERFNLHIDGFMPAWRLIFAYLCAIILAGGAACYLVTAYFLKKRLNLE